MQEVAKHLQEVPEPIEATTDLTEIGLAGVEQWLKENQKIALETTANPQSKLWHDLSATVGLVKTLSTEQQAAFSWKGTVSEVYARALFELSKLKTQKNG